MVERLSHMKHRNYYNLPEQSQLMNYVSNDSPQTNVITFVDGYGRVVWVLRNEAEVLS